MSEQNTEYFKIAVLGDTDTGKTQLINQYVKRRFNVSHVGTIGADFSSKKNLRVFKHFIQLQIWDTAGQDRLRSLGLQLLPNTGLFLICFSLAKPFEHDAFSDHIDKLIKEAKEYSKNEEVKFFLVGTKADINNNAISTELIKAIARTLSQKHFKTMDSIPYFETSAKNNDGVDELFDAAAKAIFEQKHNEKVSKKIVSKRKVYKRKVYKKKVLVKKAVISEADAKEALKKIRKSINNDINTYDIDNKRKLDGGFFASRRMPNCLDEKIRVHHNIKKIHRLCEKGLDNNNPSMTAVEACKKIHKIVYDKELNPNKLLTFIRDILAFLGLGPNKEQREKLDACYEDYASPLPFAKPAG